MNSARAGAGKELDECGVFASGGAEEGGRASICVRGLGSCTGEW